MLAYISLDFGLMHVFDLSFDPMLQVHSEMVLIHHHNTKVSLIMGASPLIPHMILN